MNFKKNNSYLNNEILLDVCAMIGCGSIYSLAFVVFLEPAQISPGGVAGLAAVIHYLFNFLPTGVVLLILNVPLIISAWFKFGRDFIIKTLGAILSSSFFIDFFDFFLPKYNGDRILASLAGGGIMGCGLALVLMRGFTSGGTDIAARFIKERFPFVSLGRVLLVADSIVVIIAALAYRNIETALYSLMTLFTSSKVIDGLLYGLDRGKLFFIISSKAEVIKNKIFEKVERGVTSVKVSGGYTLNDTTLLLCAVRRHQVSKVFGTIKESDPKAFVIITEAGEIFGEGFKKTQ